MNKKSYSQILDNAARDRLAKNTDLAPRILLKIQKGKNTTMKPRMKVFATMLLVLLVLAVMSINVPGVLAALQRWVGYVPEAGRLVSDGQIRILSKPVSITRGNVTLTVNQLLATSHQTFVQYSVEGLERKMADVQTCNQDALLRLSQRDILIENQAPIMIGGEKGYEVSAAYPAIPMTVDEVTFVMPCIMQAMPGESSDEWTLPLHLVPAPPEMTVFPVIENSTSVKTDEFVQPPANSALSADEVSLVIDRAVLMDDGCLLYITIHWEDSGLSWIELPDPATLHLLDSDGNEIAFNIDYYATNPVLAAAPARTTAFAIKTGHIQASEPLTLILDTIAANMTTAASFSFNLGTDPKPGQSWELNQTIDMGFGHSLRVSKITYDIRDDDYVWLGFDMASETGITRVSLFDQAHPMTGIENNDSGETSASGQFTSNFYYQEPYPTGLLTIDVTSFKVNLPGKWETTWAVP